jgi:hypothetical protein
MYYIISGLQNYVLYNHKTVAIDQRLPLDQSLINGLYHTILMSIVSSLFKNYLFTGGQTSTNISN